MDPFLPEPLEPIVDPRWEHLVLALAEWGATACQIAAHQAEYHAYGPEDGELLHEKVCDVLRRFLPGVLEELDPALIDDTALGVNVVQSWFAREVLFLPKGVTIEDLFDEADAAPPRNRAQRRSRGRRARRR